MTTTTFQIRSVDTYPHAIHAFKINTLLFEIRWHRLNQITFESEIGGILIQDQRAKTKCKMHY